MSWEPESKTKSFPCPYCEIKLGKIKQAYKKNDGIFKCSGLGGCGKEYVNQKDAKQKREKYIKEKTSLK